MKKDFIPQRARVLRRVHRISNLPKSVLRPANCHFDLVKSGIVDGVSSSTGLFDEAFGEVPSIFQQKQSRLDLADALLRHGASTKQASKAAADGIQVEK